MRGLRLGLAGFGPVALVLMAGSAAAAKPGGSGLQTVASKPTTVSGANTVGFANATCPKGSRAVGGGYETAPTPTTTGTTALPVVFESRGAERGWSVGMTNVTAGTTTLTSFVYCRAGRLKVREVAGTASLGPAPRSESTATASCPKGTRVISGGFHTTGVLNASYAYLTNLAPAGSRAWTITAVRNSTPPQGGGAAPITAYAYCAKIKGGDTRTGTASATTSAGNVYLSAATPRCAKDRLATGGGFSAPYAQNGATREATLVTRLKRKGRTWRAFGVALGNTGLTLNLTAIALCR